MRWTLSALTAFLMIAECISTESSAIPKASFPGNIFSAIFGGNKNRFCDCKCGESNTRNAKLYGGTVLKSHEFPWLAFINLKGIKQISATILNNRYLLTAATPVVSVLPFDLKVTVGAHYICFPELTSTNYSVAEILYHPEYQAVKRLNDLALVKLATSILFEHKIQPICLPTPGYKYNGQVSYIASWLKENNDKSCEPRRVGVPILNRIDCPAHISDRQGCLGSSNSLCKADVGSGLFYQTRVGYYELVGILSDQQLCHQQHQRNASGNDENNENIVFTNTDNYLHWILSNTRDACYCYKP